MWGRGNEESPVKEIEINARGMTFRALADGPEDGGFKQLTEPVITTFMIDQQELW
jgi:hypothetical protein